MSAFVSGFYLVERYLNLGVVKSGLVGLEEGEVRPDLPEGTKYNELACPFPLGHIPSFALYRIFEPGGTPDGRLPKSVLPVLGRLEALLSSAEQYPPAMALLKMRAMDCSLGTEAIEVPAFLEFCETCLATLLGAQHEDGFVLAEVRQLPGTYRWIIGFEEASGTVVYVDDCFDANPEVVENFLVSRDVLRGLPIPGKGFVRVGKILGDSLRKQSPE